MRASESVPRFTRFGRHSALPLHAGLGIIEACMQFQSIQNAIDLLPPPPPPPDQALAEYLAGTVQPKLEVELGSFHQGFWSGVAAQFGPRAGKEALGTSPFRDSWVE